MTDPMTDGGTPSQARNSKTINSKVLFSGLCYLVMLSTGGLGAVAVYHGQWLGVSFIIAGLFAVPDTMVAISRTTGISWGSKDGPSTARVNWMVMAAGYVIFTAVVPALAVVLSA